jgi:hypothetical protein
LAEVGGRRVTAAVAQKAGLKLFQLDSSQSGHDGLPFSIELDAEGFAKSEDSPELKLAIQALDVEHLHLDHVLPAAPVEAFDVDQGQLQLLDRLRNPPCVTSGSLSVIVRPSPPRRRPDGGGPGSFVVGSWSVFYEKASEVKAALAAFLIGSSERRSIPESSIRTV